MNKNSVGSSARLPALARRLLSIACLAVILPASTLMAQPAGGDARETVRLSPQIRELPLGTTALAIPRHTIEKFLTGNRIIEAETQETAPYILSSATENLVIGAGDEVFLTGVWENPLLSYDIFRPGATYTDPVTKEVLGLEAIHLGTVNVEAGAESDVRRGVIRTTRRELKAGDKLLPREAESLQHTFHPRRPAEEMEGLVIGLLGEKSLAAQYDAVVLNLGERDGVEVGDLFVIYAAGQNVRDPVSKKDTVLPGSESAEVLIYRRFEKLSYGLILNSTRPVSLNFEVRAR